MHLPSGVFHRPREKELIGKNRRGVVEIATVEYPGNEHYRINDRLFDFAIAPYLRGDWADLDRVFRLRSNRIFKEAEQTVEFRTIYSSAEYTTPPHKPSIMVLPNLQVAELRGREQPFFVLGCTMGQWHAADSAGPRIQEVYEFQSYGLLAVDREEGEVEVWVAQDRDKVSLPGGCHVTLYNLGDEDHPLITLNFADPNRKEADKKIAEEIGPVLLASYDDTEVTFTMNQLHINNPKHKAGARLPMTSSELEDRRIRIIRVGRLDLGAFLYEQLTENSELIGRFAQLGIWLRKASPEGISFTRNGGSRLYFSRPLVDAIQPGTDVYRCFISTQHNPSPENADEVGIVGRESRAASQKKKLGRPKLKHSHIKIVVEGAGAWVTDAYRPVFEELAKKVRAQGKRIRVIYADDSRWKETPKWTAALRDHEAYLDKANPEDFALYCNLSPDIVFVVTPDFTHSDRARWWLSKRAPLVFVEKPFDSQLKNVDALFNALGRNPVTTILGLDHYQFRAQRIRDILSEVVGHLGGALAKIEFYMTETQALELGRIRTLQYGLTLDMLPHMLALLTFFGDVGSIDDIQVLDAGRYGPEFKAKGTDRQGKQVEEDVSSRFHNETYSKVKFTFEDYSGNHFRVPCTAVVGKGFKRATKYLEITGRNGNAIRVEFGGKPHSDPAPGYPWGHIMLLFGGVNTSGKLVSDPHGSGRKLCISRNRQAVEASKDQYYRNLIEDLVSGKSKTLGSTLLPSEAWEIVRALDRVWWAIQEFRKQKGWSEQVFQQMDPI